HGLSNQEVANRKYVSVHTVAFHLRQIFRKLGISSRVELARIAVENTPASGLAQFGFPHASPGSHGRRHGGLPRRSKSAPGGPKEPLGYPSTGGGASISGWMIRQVSSTQSSRANSRWSPRSMASSSRSYGSGGVPSSSANRKSR